MNTHRIVFELNHTLISLVIQGVIWALTRDLWLGAAASSFLWIGREHTQAEYRWIEKYGDGMRKNLPSLLYRFQWYPLDIWDVHSWFFNLTLPVIVVIAIAALGS